MPRRVKKAKKIWGVVLMCLAAFFLVMMIVNIKEAEIVPIIVLIAASFGSGLALYLVGNKK